MKVDITTVYLFGIPPYLFFSALGVAFACSAFILLLLRSGYSIPRYTRIFVLSGIGLLAGARLFGYFAQLYAGLAGATLAYTGMALVFYGGMVGFLASFVALCRVWDGGLDARLVDLAIVCFPLFHIWGRLACFFAGCCYGVESDALCAIEYTNVIGGRVVTALRIPTQLFEAAGNLALFLFLLRLLRSERFKGRLALFYIVSYAVMRCILEFFRADLDRGIWNGLSFSQFLSLLALACCFLFLLLRPRAGLQEQRSQSVSLPAGAVAPLPSRPSVSPNAQGGLFGSSSMILPAEPFSAGILLAGLARGAALGLGLVLALYALAFAAELLNYALGGVFHALRSVPPSWAARSFLPPSWTTLVSIFNIWRWRDVYALASFFLIAAAPVGAVYAYALHKQLLSARQGGGLEERPAPRR